MSRQATKFAEGSRLHVAETAGIRVSHIYIFKYNKGKFFVISKFTDFVDKIKNHTENDRSYIRAGDIVENGK